MSQEFDLELASQPNNAQLLALKVFQSRITDYQQVGRGFYGIVYRATLDRPPYTAIFKWHKLPGCGVQEEKNLALVRQHSLLKVPDVYAVHTADDTVPYECVLMETLPGVTASQVTFPDDASRACFVEQIVTNLLALHAVSNPRGFGELAGPFYPTWQDFYHTRVEREYRAVLPLLEQEGFPPLIRQLVEETYAAFDRILAHAGSTSSLVHSDYNIWNYMIDPQTYQITGIIDPMMTCWADRELDLFHLYNGPVENLGLIDRYLASYPADDEFYLRSYFYRFWDDIHHYNALPGPLRPYILESLIPYAQKLAAEMDRHL